MDKDVALGCLLFIGCFAFGTLFAGAITYLVANAIGVKVSFLNACVIGTVIGIFFSAGSTQK